MHQPISILIQILKITPNFIGKIVTNNIQKMKKARSDHKTYIQVFIIIMKVLRDQKIVSDNMDFKIIDPIKNYI